MVEELERKKQLILSIVMKDHDKYLESSEAANMFSENYNKVRHAQIRLKIVHSCTHLLTLKINFNCIKVFFFYRISMHYF